MNLLAVLLPLLPLLVAGAALDPLPAATPDCPSILSSLQSAVPTPGPELSFSLMYSSRQAALSTHPCPSVSVPEHLSSLHSAYYSSYFAWQSSRAPELSSIYGVCSDYLDSLQTVNFTSLAECNFSRRTGATLTVDLDTTTTTGAATATSATTVPTGAAGGGRFGLARAAATVSLMAVGVAVVMLSS